MSRFRLLALALAAAGVPAAASAQVDVTPPAIAISGIADGQHTAETPVMACFASPDEDLASIEGTLDDVPFPGSCASVVLEGPHVLLVRARDTAGNESTRAVQFVIDVTAPSLAVVAPLDGTSVAADAAEIVASASDAGALEEVSAGDVLLAPGGDGLHRGTVLLFEGANAFDVVAVDRAGNRTTRTITIFRDTLAPALLVSTPGEGALVGTTSVVVSGRASDASELTVTVEGAAISLGLDGSFATTLELSPGAHAVTVAARDAFDHVRSETRQFVIRLEPVLSVREPRDGFAATDSPITFAGTAVSAAGAAVTLTVNGASVSVGGDGAFSGSVSSSSGAVALTFVATDANGRTAEQTISGTLAAPPPPPPTAPPPEGSPSVSLSAPADGTITRADEVAVSGTVSGGTPPYQVTVAGRSAAVDGGAFHVALALVEGEHVLRVDATDASGRIGSAERRVAVDRTPPTLGITRPAATSSDATATPLLVQGTASDARLAGVTVQEIAATLDGTSFSATVPLQPGRNAVRVDATDAAGNATSRWLDVTLSQSTGPLALVLDSPADGAILGSGAVAVTGRVEGGTLPVSVTVNGVAVSASSGPFATTVNLAEGDRIVSVAATDAAGQRVTAERRVSIDETAPLLEIARPATSPTQVSESPYLVQGTAGDPHLASVTVGGEAAVVVAGQFSRAVPLVAGTNTVRVTATDIVGHATTHEVVLDVAALPPQVTIVEPLDGASAGGPVVTVRARVDATTALQGVTIGSGPARLENGMWVADFALALGDNVVEVRAVDAAGLTGTASVRVRYSDVSREPLAVVAVDPPPGSTGVAMNALVSVSFNKPVVRDGLAAGFTVSVDGQRLDGGYSLAPGEQTATFIARAPLPPGGRVQVRVADVPARSAPGMADAFVSDFTVRPPYRFLQGNVADVRLQPLGGVRVEIEGKGLATRTGPDGAWTIPEVPAGTAVVRFEGSTAAGGDPMPVIRRRIFVNEKGDTTDDLLVLVPIDARSAERVDGRFDVHVGFAGRHPGMSLSVPAGGLFFDGGRTEGTLSATELPPWAVPVPVEAAMVPAAIWQLQPADVRVMAPITLSLPNRSGLEAGRYAVLLAYDPARHLLQRVGLGQVSTDGSVVRSLEPFEARGIDLLGYAHLSDEQNRIATEWLNGNQTPVAPPPGSTGRFWEEFFGPRPTAASVLGRLLMAPLGGGSAWALALGDGLFPSLDQAGAAGGPGLIHIGGTVRSPQERMIEVEFLSRYDGEFVVSTDDRQEYRLPIGFFVSADADDREGVVEATLRASRVVAGPPGPDGKPTWIGREPVSPLGDWGQETPLRANGSLQVQKEVPLIEGDTLITVDAREASAPGAVTTATRRLVATLKLLPPTLLPGGAVDPAAPRMARVRVIPNDDSIDRVLAGTNGTTFFKNWPITAYVGREQRASTDDVGRYSVNVIGYGAAPGLICTRLDTGLRWNAYSDAQNPGKVVFYWFREGYPICSSGYFWPGGSGRVNLTVDARLLVGDVGFFNRDERPVEGACDEAAATEWDPRTNELRSIAQGDVSTTEVYVFREDDLTEPIARYGVVAPCVDPSTGQKRWAGGAHGNFVILRRGPADWNVRRVQNECLYLEATGQTSYWRYQAECLGKKNVNFLRLSAGDRLVVVGVNHATGYTGISNVVVPPLNKVGVNNDGSCPEPPITFPDYGASWVSGVQWLTISPCAQQDVRIRADLRLYPAEVDVRVARQSRDQGAAQTADGKRTTLVRHGGAATTKDEFIQVSSQWRARLPSPTPTPTSPGYVEWLAAHGQGALQPTPPSPYPKAPGGGDEPGAIADTFDTDVDGIVDRIDRCPYLPGDAAAQGCPSWMDVDRDQVLGAADHCPAVPGPPETYGCPDPSRPGWTPPAPPADDPDPDLDRVLGADDRCPEYAGPAANDGCPDLRVRYDMDLDGVADPVDECVMWPGPKENNGCPNNNYAAFEPPTLPTYQGAPGHVLEAYCSELSTPTPELLSICNKVQDRLVDVPPGVPPLAGRLVKVTNGASAVPAVIPFPILPGRHTNNVQAAFRVLGGAGGSGAVDVFNLQRANYYLHVVGNSVLANDRNNDARIDPTSEIAVSSNGLAPPAFAEPSSPPPGWPAGMPERAIPVKAVYRSWEPDGSLVERFDRSREHEFRVLDVTLASIVAEQGATARRVDTPPEGETATADEGDLRYEMLMSVLAPEDPGRAGTLSGEYRIRLGSDLLGIECTVTTNADTHTVSGDCGGESLYDVLAASDLLYAELYLSGNAENVLYRYNFSGIVRRLDYVSAGSRTTAQDAIGTKDATARRRSVQEVAKAQVFVRPDQVRAGTLSFCIDPVCPSGTVLKSLRVTADDAGTYTMAELGGSVTWPVRTGARKGAMNATLFELPLPPWVGWVQGYEGEARSIFAVIRADGAATPLVVQLGRARGTIQAASAHSRGQPTVHGVNLADGHLSLEYEDAALPEFATEARFVRRYNNQTNVPGALGVGWSHEYEGFIVEETPGRYAVVLGGQGYAFDCTYRAETDTATPCASDGSHGATLDVGKTLGGGWDITFTAVDGVRYKFDEPSRSSRVWNEAGKLVDVYGRRRWKLTAFEDGHGRPDPITGGIGPGWTRVTYVKEAAPCAGAPPEPRECETDRVDVVERIGGKVRLKFQYHPRPVSPQGWLRAMPDFAFLRSVTLTAGAGVTHEVSFAQDAVGNLTTVARAGSPELVWSYAYESADELAMRMGGDPAGMDRKPLANELRSATAAVRASPGAPAVRQSTVEYRRTCTAAVYGHVRRGEFVDEIVLPGYGGAPIRIAAQESSSGSVRTVSEPSAQAEGARKDLVTEYTLNPYGNPLTVTVTSVDSRPTATMTWWTDEMSGAMAQAVALRTLQSPAGRKLEYAYDSRLREKTVTVAALPPGRPAAGVAVGTVLRNVLSFHERFGTPLEVESPAQDGRPTRVTRQLWPTGDPRSVTVADPVGALVSERSFEWSPEGELAKETNGSGVAAQVTTYVYDGAPENAFGLPRRVTRQRPGGGSGQAPGLELATRNLGYDSYGRLVSDELVETGALETWAYDALGRLTAHSRLGQPGQAWAYEIVDEEDGHTVRERLNGEAEPRRARTFRYGLPASESFRYDVPAKSATRTWTHEFGNLVRLEDERGVTHRYSYDGAGRLSSATADGPGPTPPAGGGPTPELTVTYDLEGRPLTRTDHNGLTTTFEYDVLGRAAYRDEGVGGDPNTEALELDVRGAVTKRVVSGVGTSHTYTFQVDPLGRTRVATSSDGSVNEETDYDDAGRLLAVRDRVTGLEQGFEYDDALGRATKHWRKVQGAESDGAAELYHTEMRTYVDRPDGAAGTRVTATHGADWKDGAAQGANTWREMWTEDPAGLVLDRTTWVHGAPAERTFTYDALGNVLTASEPSPGDDGSGNPLPGPTTAYTRDAQGAVVVVTDPRGDTITYTRDATGLVLTQAGPLSGELWTNTYDAFGQPKTRTIDAWGTTPTGTWTWAWSAPGKVLETDPLGYTTERTHDAGYRVVKEVRKDDGGTRQTGNTLETTTIYVADALSSKAVVEGAAASTWSFSYDARGRERSRTETWSASGMQYDYRSDTEWQGRVGTVSRNDGKTVRLVHDSLGNVIAKEQGGFTSTWGYDAAGRLAVKRPAGLPPTAYDYTDGLLVGERFGAAPNEPEVTSYTYHPHGRVHTVARPDGRARTYEYDTRGQVQAETYGWAGDEARSFLDYDAAGRLKRLTKGSDANEGTQYVYGPRGELQTVRQPGGAGVFTYQYDAGARVSKIRPDGYLQPTVTGAAEQVREHDYLGREVSRKIGASSWDTTWTAGRATTIEPGAGKLHRLVDGRGRTARIEYEPAGEAARFSVQKLEYTYSTLDQPLVSTEYGTGGRATTHQYDARDLLWRVERGSSVVVYAYEPSGEPSSISFDALWGLVTTRQIMFSYYPESGRLMWVDDGALRATYWWERGGDAIAAVRDVNVHEERCYDGPGRLKAMIAVRSDGSPPSCVDWPPVNPLAAVKYAYDDRGNRTTERYVNTNAFGEAVTEYGYDAADRLTGVQYENGTAALYKLGADGTRVGEKQFTEYSGSLDASAFDSSQQPGTPLRHSEYAFDSKGQISSESQYVPPGGIAPDKVLTRSWQWDDDGHLTFERNGAGDVERQLSWDAASRVREARSPRGFTEYAYEADGLRSWRKHTPSPVPGEPTPSAIERAWVWAKEAVVAQKTEGQAPLIYSTYGPEAAYAGTARVIRDGIRSPIATIEDGIVARQWRYGIWGEYRDIAPHEAAPSDDAIGFTGHTWDVGPRLIYAQQRWYDPSIGRFVSRDPADGKLEMPGSINPYLYAAANPAAYTDPNGASPTLVSGGVGAVFGALVGAVTGCVDSIYASKSWGHCGEQAAKDAFKGALIGGAAGLSGGMAGGAVSVTRAAGTMSRALAVTIAENAVGGAVAGVLGSAAEAGGLPTADAAMQGAAEGTAMGLAGFAGGKLASRIGRKAFGASSLLANAVRYGPMNPGPLHPDIASTFRSATYTAETLAAERTLYRVIGNEGNPLGRFWTSERPKGPLQATIDFALDQSWGNTATRVVEARIPAGTTIYYGPAAAQRGLVGGATQVYLPRVAEAWIEGTSFLSIGRRAAGGGTTAIQRFYPQNSGFLGETTQRFLYAGERIDRFGGSGASRFFSPAGTPAGARALPPGTSGQPLRTFEVVKPFEVEAGTVAPAFGQPGFGTQFRTPAPLETLLKRGILREVTP